MYREERFGCIFTIELLCIALRETCTLTVISESDSWDHGPNFSFESSSGRAFEPWNLGRGMI